MIGIQLSKEMEGAVITYPKDSVSFKSPSGITIGFCKVIGEKEIEIESMMDPELMKTLQTIKDSLVARPRGKIKTNNNVIVAFKIDGFILKSK